MKYVRQPILIENKLEKRNKGILQGSTLSALFCNIYFHEIHSISDHMHKIKACTSHELLLLYEAQARKEYYSCFDFFVKNEELVFEKRSRRPPENEINAMLSFGYTVLYNTIAHKIYKSSLDIQVGYLHSTSMGRKESLNLDIAEIFKPLIIDRAIFASLNLGILSTEDFQTEDNGGVYLNENGKRKFLRRIYDKLDDTLQYRGRQYSYAMLLDEEIKKLVRFFRNGETYSAYRQVR